MPEGHTESGGGSGGGLVGKAGNALKTKGKQFFETAKGKVSTLGWGEVSKDQTLTRTMAEALTVKDVFVEGIMKNTADKTKNILQSFWESGDALNPLIEGFTHPIKRPDKALLGILKTTIAVPTEALNVAGSTVSNLIKWTHDAAFNVIGKPLAKGAHHLGNIPIPILRTVGKAAKGAINIMNWGIGAPFRIANWTREKAATVLGYPRDFIRKHAEGDGGAATHEAQPAQTHATPSHTAPAHAAHA